MNLRVFFSVLLIGVAFPALATTTGCTAPASKRVAAVQTLKAVGHSAEAAVTLTANLYAANRITAAQAKQVMDLYDHRFQTAFRIAVSAVNANLDSFASPELVELAAQLSALVASFAQSP